MSVLRLDLVYVVKYNPLPSGVPSGFALGNSFMQRVIFDRISLVSSIYGYSKDCIPGLTVQLQFVQGFQGESGEGSRTRIGKNGIFKNIYI